MYNKNKNRSVEEELQDFLYPSTLQIPLNSQTELTSVAKKLRTRSSLTAYLKNDYFDQLYSTSSSDRESSTQQKGDKQQQHTAVEIKDGEENHLYDQNDELEDYYLDDNLAIAEYDRQRDARLKSRQTDGFFNKEHNFPVKEAAEKPKSKRHIFARRATYLSHADKKRLSLRIPEEYRRYSREYKDLGYGVIINVLSYLCNVYMHYFSCVMRVSGNFVQELQDRFSSANVGYGMMILSNTFYLVPTIYIKCNPHIDFSIAVMTRGIFATLMICKMAHVKQQELIQFPRYDMIRLFYRGIFTSVSQIYFFFTLGKLPLSINMIISNTGPIFVFLMSVLFLDGELRVKDVIGIVVAVFGVFCAANPDLVTSFFVTQEAAAVLPPTGSSGSPIDGESSGASLQLYSYAEGTEKLVYIGVFLLIYVGWAYGVLMAKQLQKANTLAMNFFVAVSFMLVGSFAVLFRPSSIFDLSWFDVFNLIFFVGVFSFGSQYTFITSTFLNHNHGPLTMLGYLSVIKSYIIQMLFFHEMPSFAEIIGSVFVLIGVAKIVIH